LWALAFLVAALLSSQPVLAQPAKPFSQCPKIGASNSCAVLYIFNADGSTSVYADTSVGPYDSDEDTLVGVINNSGKIQTSLTLSGVGKQGLGIFDFDGDGICTSPFLPFSPPPGRPQSEGSSYCSGTYYRTDPGDYAGPMTTFSSISTKTVKNDTGTINFTGGLAPGASTYFSLEDQLNSATVPPPPPVAGGVTLADGPVFTESGIVGNSCVTTHPASATFFATDPVVTVWFMLAGLGAQNTVLARFSFNGTLQPNLDAGPYTQFSSGSTYAFCPSFIPNPAGAGPWTLTIYVDGQAFRTIPFTISSGSGGPTLGGTYICTFGPSSSGTVTLTQNGTSLTGTLPNGGTLTGTVSVTVVITFTGTWTSNSGTGTITFTSPDGNTFTGTWTRTSGTVDPGGTATTSTTGTVSGTKSTGGTASCPASAFTGNNVIGNGGFELPAGSTSYNQIGTFLPCWMITLGNIDYVGPDRKDLWLPSEGSYSLDMDGNKPGGIAQTFTAQVGQQYTVAFDLAGNFGGGANIKKVEALVQDASLGGGQTYYDNTFSFDTSVSGPNGGRTNATSMGWQCKSFNFTPTFSRISLSLISLDSDPNGNYGPALDNVRVLPTVPGSTPCANSGGGSSSGFTLYNTGVQSGFNSSSPSSGVLLSDGGVDSHYKLIASADPSFAGANAFAASSTFGGWVPNSSSLLSKWIAPRPDAVNGNSVGNYTYRTTFDLTGLNPATAAISGRYSSDNGGAIRLNGTQVGATVGANGFNAWTPFTISSGFVAGTNNLDFVVNNADCGGCVNATGLRVEFTSATASSSSGGGGGATSNPSCSYGVTGLSQPNFPAAGVNPAILGGLVTADKTPAANCFWATSSPDNWIHATPTTAAPTIGSGSWSFTIDANTGPQRQTTLKVADKSVTIVQLAGTAGCTYLLTATSNSTPIPGLGGSGQATVTVGGSGVCSFSVPSTADVQITSAKTFSGTGDKTFTYFVIGNPGTSARNLPLTITGTNPAKILTYTVNQAPGLTNAPNGPVISQGGVVNAASFIPASLPGGEIAQGSFFSIFGTNLGPANPGVTASAYPLGDSLANVSITVTQGGVSYAAIPQFVAQFQVNGIMPSTVPPGTAQVTVTYNGLTSNSVTITVVAHSIGIFAVSGGKGPGIIQNFVSGQVPLNTTSTTAAPGQTAILLGTGLGALPPGTLDSQAITTALPILPTAQVFVGGVSAQVVYSGRAPFFAGIDQINFVVPQSAPQGCFVPVQVSVAGIYSNSVTMAIGPPGKPCVDDNPFSSFSTNGGKAGTIVLTKFTLSDSTGTLGNGSLEAGLGLFQQLPANGPLGFSLFTSLPPLNSCSSYADLSSLSGLLGGQLPSGTGGVPLDAGASITIKGPNGTQTMSYQDSTAKTSPYFSAFAATGALAGFVPAGTTPYLSPGGYTVSAGGGKDVGAFSFNLNVALPATWTNRDQISTVNTSQNLAINWSGGNSATQRAIILGLSYDPNQSGNSALFVCQAQIGPSGFTVPAGELVKLGAKQGSSPKTGVLVFATVPSPDQFTSFTAPSLDMGLGFYLIADVRLVSFQ
jgi:uncharacterized protein (TIGR03437 family)